MFSASSLHNFKNNTTTMFVYAFLNFKTDLINFIINLISISFYIVVFAQIFNKQVNNYFSFLLPGLIIINMLSAVSYQALKLWSLGSASKLMGYWLSLPHSLEYLLLTFSFMAVFSSIMYTLPLILVVLFLHFTINAPLWFLVIGLSGLFLFFLNFGLVLYFFKTNSFIIVFNVSQPLLLRISPIFYPLMYLPLFALPLSFFNPITWIVGALRGSVSLVLICFVCLILDILFFKILLRYWQKKIRMGDVL